MTVLILSPLGGLIGLAEAMLSLTAVGFISLMEAGFGAGGFVLLGASDTV